MSEQAFSVETKALGVVAAIGYLPAAALGALRLQMLDLVDHHRSAVGKQVGADFPGRRRAQKMFFALSARYGAKPGQAKSIDDLYGRSFAVQPSAIGASGSRVSQRFWDLLQQGGRVTASAPFFIPFKSGGGAGSFDVQFRGDGPFTIARNGLVFLKSPGSRTSRAAGSAVLLGASGGPVARGVAIGVIRRSRQSRKLLRFFEIFDSILPKHDANMDRAMEDALTAAGRVRLGEKNEALAGTLAKKFRDQKDAIFDAAGAAAAADAAKLGEASTLGPSRGRDSGGGGKGGES